MKAQKCPICGAASLKKNVGIESFEYKGKIKEIPNYITYACSKCGEAVVDGVTLKESEKVLKDFKREVDGLLTGEQIKTIRKNLGLTQEQMADILGGGLKSFARYESGQVCQSKGMDNLLRILDAYPDTLKVIQRSVHTKSFFTNVTYIEEVRTNRSYRSPKTSYSCDAKEVAYGS